MSQVKGPLGLWGAPSVPGRAVHGIGWRPVAVAVVRGTCDLCDGAARYGLRLRHPRVRRDKVACCSCAHHLADDPAEVRRLAEPLWRRERQRSRVMDAGRWTGEGSNYACSAGDARLALQWDGYVVEVRRRGDPGWTGLGAFLRIGEARAAAAAALWPG